MLEEVVFDTGLDMVSSTSFAKESCAFLLSLLRVEIRRRVKRVGSRRDEESVMVDYLSRFK